MEQMNDIIKEMLKPYPSLTAQFQVFIPSVMNNQRPPGPGDQLGGRAAESGNTGGFSSALQG